MNPYCKEPQNSGALFCREKSLLPDQVPLRTFLKLLLEIFSEPDNHFNFFYRTYITVM